MVVNVDYEIRQPRHAYPIQCDDSCLDAEPLRRLVADVNEFIDAVDRANILIQYAEGSRLVEIMHAITEEICYGRNEFDAVIMVSHKYKLPLNMVFLAYSLEEDYRYAHELYIMANVIKILSEIGIKPMQIYKKINALPDSRPYSYRNILEVLKAWGDDQYITLKFLNKNNISQ